MALEASIISKAISFHILGGNVALYLFPHPTKEGNEWAPNLWKKAPKVQSSSLGMIWSAPIIVASKYVSFQSPESDLQILLYRVLH